jgi:hypothetical protein
VGYFGPFSAEGIAFCPHHDYGGGDKANQDGRSINIPQRDLVSTIQVFLQRKRLKISNLLPEAQILLEKMTNFQVKIPQTGHDSYGAWREGIHDDLLLYSLA